MNKPLTWHYVHITFTDGVYGKKVFSYESSAAYTLALQDARMLNSGTMFTGKVVKFTVLIEPTEQEIEALSTPSAELPVELTDEVIDKIFDAQYKKYGQVCDAEDFRMFARAVAAAQGGK